MSHQVSEVRTQQEFLDISCLQSLLQSVPPGLQQSDLPLEGQNLRLTLISRPLLSLVLPTVLLGLALIVLQPLVVLLFSLSLSLGVRSGWIYSYLDPIFQSRHNFCSHVL